MWFDRIVEAVRETLRLAVACVLFALAALLLAKFASGPIGDYILANAVRTDERKMPPTVTNYRVGAEDIDIVGGMGQGLSCSLPGFVETLGFPRDDKTASISLQMRQACVHHDLCYRHGAATYGYGQVDCDILLQQNAFKLCTQIGLSESSVTRCESEARKITLGVLLGGADSFRRADSAPSDSQPGCAYCRYLKVWNAWRKDYWSEPLAAWDARSSTYYEFDGHPQRSNEFVSVRIADAPRFWAGVQPKAYYVFRTRPSGVQLRILGLRKDGSRLCAAYTLGGDFRFRSSLPVATRMRRRENGAVEDWFVWMRQNETSRPETAFSGLAPGRASAGDWFRVFGSGRDITGDALCDGQKSRLSASTPKASFVDAKAKNADGEERFVGLNAVYPDIPSAPAALVPGVMRLFGLTDDICARDGDRSSCVVGIQLTTERTDAAVQREPFKTLEANCLPKQTLPGRFDDDQTQEHCDAYRNFVLPPRIVRDGETTGLAWTRRGKSNGDGYPRNAVLRRGPAENPKGPDPTYPEIELKQLTESLEPAAMSAVDAEGRHGMVSIVSSPVCGGLKIVRFALVPNSDASGSHQRSTWCLPGLDATWLARPWRLIDGRKVMMFRMTFSELAVCENRKITYCVEKPWPTSGLEVAEFDLDLAEDPGGRPDRADTSRSIAAVKSPILVGQYFCLLEKPDFSGKSDLSGQKSWLDNQDSRKHIASSTPCAPRPPTKTGIDVGVEVELSQTKLDDEARLRDISSLINRAPLIVGDIDGDASPEVALLSLTFDEVLLFAKPGGETQWRRFAPPAGRP